ncbi:MAG: MBOAT family O-acyltransferase [Pseudomonadota bacterium]
MSFASYGFLFEFLPVALALVWLATAVSSRLILPAILLVSLAFYAFSSIAHLGLLAGLVVATWSISWIWDAVKSTVFKRVLLTLAILLNLGALGIWKYGDSLIEVWNAIGLPYAEQPGLLLPLGISFYALQQIGYLADLARGRTERRSLGEYAAFVLFFPQLLAGPIVKHSRMSAEFDRLRAGIGISERMDMAAIGFVWIAMGLFKKTVIADTLGRIITPHIALAASGEIASWQAWQIFLAGAPRIYFDFSGYSDMAIGLGLLFGIRLPYNFDAPFRVDNFREGWRRWHITFHQFIRDHVYAPLRRLFPNWSFAPLFALFVSAILSGLWHVDNLQFVAWGTALFVFLWAGSRLSFRVGKGGNLARYMVVEVAACGVLTTLLLVASADVMRVLTALFAFSAGSGAAQTPLWLIGLQFAFIIGIYAFAKTEISTQILLNGAHDHKRRHIFGWRPPVFRLEPFWALFFAALFLCGLWFAGFSAPFIYFQF